jgi:hypothetical protein
MTTTVSHATPGWWGEPAGTALASRREALLILARGESEAALEVAVQVTLVGEASGSGGLGDRLASFEQSAGGTDAVSDLQRVGWQTGPLAE